MWEYDGVRMIYWLSRVQASQSSEVTPGGWETTDN